jgi:uncharacterized protein (TIGR00251 family)
MNFPAFMGKSVHGTTLEVYVQPRASRNELAGIHKGTLKIRLTAPPVEDEANKECLKFLAKAFGIPKSNLEIIQGQKSRHKTILFRGVSPEFLHNILKQAGII